MTHATLKSNADADSVFMQHALNLAENGLYTTAPNPAVGCVLVKEGRVVAEGWHEYAGGPHAEVVALRAAGEQAKGCVAYVSLEPCSHYGRTGPCADALITAGVTRVVCAMLDPNPLVAGNGLARLREAGIETRTDVLKAEAEQLNRGFLKRMRTGLPFVTVKLGMSLDGRTALANGVSQWITSEAARHDVQFLRARTQAIITGSGTQVADNPKLTVRINDADWPNGQRPARYQPPLRVLLDSQARLAAKAHLCDGSASTLVIHRAKRPASWPVHIESLPWPSIDVVEVLRELARRGINEVLVEAGPTLSGAFVAQGLADQLVCYVAPLAMGNLAKAALNLPEFTQIADSPRFTLADCRQIGEDLRLTYRRR